MGTRKKVAKWLHISREDAAAYCQRFNDLCEANPELRGKSFIGYLRKYRALRPTPETLVALMQVKNVKVGGRRARKREQWKLRKGTVTKVPKRLRNYSVDQKRSKPQSRPGYSRKGTGKKSLKRPQRNRTRGCNNTKVPPKLKDHLVEKPRRKPQARPRYLVKSSVQDSQRVSESKLERCPHGVPRNKVCAICDPEKFREMVGFD
jgi:hypothetical protein